MKNVMKKCTATVLCGAMLLGLGAGTVHASEPVKPRKDETVYVISAADGTQKKLTVSDWIQNTEKSLTLQDVSTLSDIENIKGEETFQKGRKNSITWKADGNDIYYQGNSKEKVPVKLSISYQLDGKPIKPEKLAGQSGKVTIRFDYENTLHESVKIKNKKEKISVPFAAVTGMMLDTDHFRNVQVTNGKMENLGNAIVVMGVAFPGMQETLALNKQDLEIPDYVEVTADVTDFVLEGTVTVVTTSFLSEVNTKDLSIDNLLRSTRELTRGTNQLIDGAGKLSEGLGTLLEKSGALVTGIDQLMDGSMKLKTGADALAGGASQLQAGANQLSQGLSTLTSNSGNLRGGAQQVFNSLLSSANAQLAANGIEASLTIGNYGQVLGGLIDNMTDGAHKAALEKVTAAVEAKRPEIEAAVAEAVCQQVRAQVQQKVTQVVREPVEAAVRQNTDAFRAVLIGQYFDGMTPDEYNAAVEAGEIPQDKQESLNAAVEAAITAEIGKQMDSDEVQGQIAAITEENMNSEEIVGKISQLTDENVKNEMEKAISNGMASEEVQSQLQAAAEGAKALTALKASLDSYNGFYLGVIQYTKGVDQASAGASDLKNGADTLKSGMDTLNTGVNSLNEGVKIMKNQAPALVDGVTQLKNGAGSLKNGLDKLMQDGIRKIADLAEDDLNTMVERLRACGDLAQAYTTFTGVSPDMEGTVKFIYRTEAIGEKD